MDDDKVFKTNDIIKQLEFLEKDYELCQKYDNPQIGSNVKKNDEVDTNQYHQINSSDEENENNLNVAFENSNDMDDELNPTMTTDEILAPVFQEDETKQSNLVDTTELKEILSKHKEKMEGKEAKPLDENQVSNIKEAMSKFNFPPPKWLNEDLSDDQILNMAKQMLDNDKK